MKKILSFFMAAVAAVGISFAQEDNEFDKFPYREGTVLVTKSYDAMNNLLSTTSYTVMGRTNSDLDSQIEIAYSIVNNTGTILDQGTFIARNDDEYLYLNINNRNFIPNDMNVLSSNIELVGGMMDYPNPTRRSLEEPYTRMAKTDPVEFTLTNKQDRSEYARVLVSNRKFDQNEIVTTPAGSFDTYKETFDIRVMNQDKVSTTFRGIEWYSTEKGIVRTEIHDTNGNLLTYTVLTEVMENR